jgi:hypothetical protein
MRTHRAVATKDAPMKRADTVKTLVTSCRMNAMQAT